SRLDTSAGRVRARMYEHRSFDNLDTKSRDLLLERGRSSPARRLVLIAVPRTSNATVDDAAFSQRSVLMLANIGDGRDLAIVAKNRNPLPRKRYDSRALLGNSIHFADFDKTLVERLMSRPIDPFLTKRRGKMKRQHRDHSRDED